MNESHNPWKIISQRDVYDNPWIRVMEFDVINPGGGKSIYGKVHFKNLAIGILPLDKDWNTYLVGQYRFTLSQYSWEMPEGGGPMNENPLDAARRELREETGLTAGVWEQLSTVHLSNSVSDEYGIIYLAQELEQFRPMPEETEQLQVRKLAFAEALDMVNNGLITDSLTVTAILKVKLMMLEGHIKK